MGGIERNQITLKFKGITTKKMAMIFKAFTGGPKIWVDKSKIRKDSKTNLLKGSLVLLHYTKSAN